MPDWLPWLRLGSGAAYAAVVFFLVRALVRRVRLSAGESKALLYALALGGVLASLLVSNAVGGLLPEAMGTLLIVAMMVGPSRRYSPS